MAKISRFFTSLCEEITVIPGTLIYLALDKVMALSPLAE
jgi:hypothetical protein